MRTSYDVLRSLNRYVSEALPDWEVRPLAEEGTFQRPEAHVQATAPQVLTGPRHTVHVMQPFAIYAYPEAGEDARESLLAAVIVEDALVQAFRVEGVGLGYPGLVPLWDYEGVDFSNSSDVRTERDFARIDDLSIERDQSPSDERLWTVTAEVRLGWSRNGLLPSGKTARELRVDQTVS